MSELYVTLLPFNSDISGCRAEVALMRVLFPNQSLPPLETLTRLRCVGDIDGCRLEHAGCIGLHQFWEVLLNCFQGPLGLIVM